MKRYIRNNNQERTERSGGSPYLTYAYVKQIRAEYAAMIEANVSRRVATATLSAKHDLSRQYVLALVDEITRVWK